MLYASMRMAWRSLRMIILIGGEKGGSSKSTLATNVAVVRALAGHDVLLLDTDTQGSASLWSQLRDASEIKPPHPLHPKIWPGCAIGSSRSGHALRRYHHRRGGAGCRRASCRPGGGTVGLHTRAKFSVRSVVPREDG